MNPQSMEWAVFQKKLKDREFKAFSLLWTTNGWEHDFEQIWHSRGIQDPGSSNYIYYSNPELDRLSDDLRQEMDLQKRIEKIRRIGRLLYEDQPYCFFGWRNGFGANWSDLKNVQGSWYFLRPFLRAFPMYVARP
jgi:peptide/nickel transport system substrate-binding protein